jgi:hypothetical protein
MLINCGLYNYILSLSRSENMTSEEVRVLCRVPPCVRGHLTVVEKKGRKVQNGLLGKWPPYGKKVEKGGRVEKGGKKGDGVRV